jgi:hypothetical protein
MRFYAMIGPVGYLATEAKSDDEARAWFAVQLHHRGDGLYKRWRDAGMRVSAFTRGLLTKEDKANGDHTGLHSGNYGADRRATQEAHPRH